MLGDGVWPQRGQRRKWSKLEQGLQNYARVLQQQTEINVCQMAGGGAAGGMGIAAAVFLNADIKPGIDCTAGGESNLNRRCRGQHW